MEGTTSTIHTQYALCLQREDITSVYISLMVYQCDCYMELGFTRHREWYDHLLIHNDTGAIPFLYLSSSSSNESSYAWCIISFGLSKNPDDNGLQKQ